MATQKDFVVKNGIIINQNLTINGKTHDRILDSADVALVARSVAVDSAGDLTGVADPAGTAVALAIALG